MSAHGVFEIMTDNANSVKRANFWRRALQETNGGDYNELLNEQRTNLLSNAKKFYGLATRGKFFPAFDIFNAIQKNMKDDMTARQNLNFATGNFDAKIENPCPYKKADDDTGAARADSMSATDMDGMLDYLVHLLNDHYPPGGAKSPKFENVVKAFTCEQGSEHNSNSC